jgi:hypothetical protein
MVHLITPQVACHFLVTVGSDISSLPGIRDSFVDRPFSRSPSDTGVSVYNVSSLPRIRDSFVDGVFSRSPSNTISSSYNSSLAVGLC